MNANKWLGVVGWNFLVYKVAFETLGTMGGPYKHVMPWLTVVILAIGVGPMLSLKLIVDWRRNGNSVRVQKTVIQVFVGSFCWATYWSFFGLGLMEILFENGQSGVIIDQGNPAWKFVVVGILYLLIFVLPVVVVWFYYIFGYLVGIGD
jgi:hypothetical protein